MAVHLYPHRQRQLDKLIQKLGLDEKAAVRWSLVDLALTHPTISADANYEQLEFVGDAVIRMAVAEFLLESHPELSVGEFSAIRSVLVSDRTLAQLASHYGLERYLLMSDSALGDVAGQESRLAEAFEALLGALYLSTHTLELVRVWLKPHLERLTIEVQRDPALQNYKAALQEWTQAHYKALPEYRVRETAPTHNSAHRFTAEVWFQGQLLGQATGRSIKQSEQAAAQVAFLTLQEQQPGNASSVK
jgi:ribonuclease III